MLLTSCTGENESRRATSTQPPEPAAEVPGTASEATVAMLELRDGQRRNFLELQGVGRFVATCDRNGRAAVTFVAAGLRQTSAVTVSSPALGTEVWQIAPFSKGNDTVTTVLISRGPSAGGPYYACGFSAQGFATPPPPD